MRMHSWSWKFWSFAVLLVFSMPLAAQQPKVLAVLGAKDKSQFLSLAFSPDGQTLAGVCSATHPWKIKLYDPVLGKSLANFDANRPSVRSLGLLVYCPDGKILASVGDDGAVFPKVKLWDAATYKLIREIDSGNYALAFSPDGKVLTTSGRHSNEIELWDPETGKQRNTLEGKKSPATRLAFSPDGKTLASVRTTARAVGNQQDGDVTLWDPATGKETGTISLKRMTTYCLGFSPDGKTLACGGLEDFLNKVELWDLAAGKATTLFKDPVGKTGSGVTGLAYTPDGKALITASSSQIALWNLATGRPTLLEGIGSNTFALSPDGATLATAGNAGSIRVWALAAKKK